MWGLTKAMFSFLNDMRVFASTTRLPMILSHYIWTSFDDHFDPEDSDCLVISASVACQLVLSWMTSWRGLSYSASVFSPWKTKRSRGQCCVWGERGPRRERWWLRPCPCRPEGEGAGHLEERQRERKENDRNMAGDRAGEGESAICLAWQQLGGLPLQVVYQEGKHHHSSTSRSTFTVNSFGGVKFTSKSFESHGFHAGL